MNFISKETSQAFCKELKASQAIESIPNLSHAVLNVNAKSYPRALDKSIR